MQEDFLHYLWKYGLYQSDKLITTQGEKVEVLAPGQFNTHAGPDFLYSRIRIGGTLWVGHTEIHVKASEWYRHNHDSDSAYQTVVLHVVYQPDCQVLREDGTPVPTVVLPVKETYLNGYHQILSTISPIPCETAWQRLEPLEVENWIIAMGIERMESRAEEIRVRLSENQGDWEATFLQLLIRTFGFGVNQDSFDRLGKSIPMQAIRYASANSFRLEALFFGQSGLIPPRPPDSYSKALAAEYDFLKRKYNLEPLVHPGWKFLRMRPANFPTVRLAQLSSMLAGNPSPMKGVVRDLGLPGTGFFDHEVSAYWKKNYDFGKPWTGTLPRFGDGALNLIRINASLPFAACYAHHHGDTHSREKWMELLEKLPPEANRVTRVWATYGYRIPNAFYSQAFLHLFNQYCHPRRCLSCRIGQHLIRNPGG